MSSTSLTYGTWNSDTGRERAMEESHRPLWRHFIQSVPEADFSALDVLDFGCNRGGFLRLLHEMRPFRRGLGIDIATDSIQAARGAAGNTPIEYQVAQTLAGWTNRFDVAFSYEVIYLLPDCAAHAAEMLRALRPGGVYYAVTGCHTENPLWPAWRTLIGTTTNAPVLDRSPDDYADAFRTAGFEVAVRRFGYDGFLPVPKDRRYYPTLYAALAYPAEHKLLFRLSKPPKD